MKSNVGVEDDCDDENGAHMIFIVKRKGEKKERKNKNKKQMENCSLLMNPYGKGAKLRSLLYQLHLVGSLY